MSFYSPPFVRGIDGKTYPRNRSTDDRMRLISVVHDLAHDGRSIRAVVRAAADQGERVSIGTVSTYLRSWRCENCSGGPDSAPEHQVGGLA